MTEAVNAFLDISGFGYDLEDAVNAFHLKDASLLTVVAAKEAKEDKVIEKHTIIEHQAPAQQPTQPQVQQTVPPNSSFDQNNIGNKKSFDVDLGLGTTLVLAGLLVGAIWLFMRWRNKK